MSLSLGFDLSTQQLKIVSCYEDLSLHSKYSINFDEFKDKYGINKGVIKNPENGEVVTPIACFIEAIQTLLDRMKLDNFPFHKVKSISGSCQQHGTVYYTSKIDDLLLNLDGNSSKWCEDLLSGFSFPDASNWQDRSTVNEIEDFELALGSSNKLCEITGSKAHYRFSGLQIRRRAKENSTNWQNTKNINLISSFLNTFLTGSFCGIEIGEACGTNLFDIKENDWNNELLSLILLKNSKIDNVSKIDEFNASEKAREMLGKIVLPNEFKKISNYLIERYGFNSDCKVWPITGDNLATIMSLPLNKNDLLISMGTSTTVLLLTEKYIPSINYHLFKHPVCPNIYMGMLCYCNGSLAREQIRDKINEKYKTNGWDKFNQLLESTKKIDNKIGIYFPLGEIIPNAKSCYREFKYDESKLIEINTDNKDEILIDEEPLLIIESQALSNRLRVSPMLSDSDNNNEDENTNFNNKTIQIALIELSKIVGNNLTIDNVSYKNSEFIKRPNTVYYVGGSSQNDSILQIYNDILGPKNGGYKVEISDACALGGCFRSNWGSSNTKLEFQDWIKEKFDFAKNLQKVKRNEEEVIEKWASYSNKMGILTLAEQELEQ
jgi:xylulokinase